MNCFNIEQETTLNFMSNITVLKNSPQVLTTGNPLQTNPFLLRFLLLPSC